MVFLRCLLLILAAAGWLRAADRNGMFRCPPSGRMYNFGQRTICWDGRTYTRDTTGLPEKMLEYFENQQDAADATQKAPPAAAKQTKTVPAPPVPTVLRAPPKPVIPITAKALDSVQPGTSRIAARRILGEPHGSIEIPEEGGLTEIWTYRVEGGKSVRIRLEHEMVVSVR